MNTRIIKHLNFDWKYAANFDQSYISASFDDSAFTTVNIPHTNTELPYNNFDEEVYQFESCYRKSIMVEERLKNRQAILHFEAVMTYACVYINGMLATEHKGGYTPFKVNITHYLRYDQVNHIVVLVDSRERNEIPPFGFIIDYLTYGGIYREVRLEFTKEVVVENCHIRTRNVLTEHKSLDLDLYLENFSGLGGSSELQFYLRDTSNTVIKKFSKEITLDGQPEQRLNVQQEVSGIQLWDTDNPTLYFLEINLITNGCEVDSKVIRFGFREVHFEVDGLKLNGKHITIRGLNRHQSFPYVGYAMPKSAQVKDADILKNELGVNTVRLSHYPQSDHFLNRCDELGLLVFDEIPGWQHVGEKGEWWDITCQHVEEMIKKDWNHPSVFIWGVRINESDDCDELYKETNRIAKYLDDTRPTGGVRCIENSNLLEDVYTFNDFSHQGKSHILSEPKKVTGLDAPYLVTEHNGHMYPTKRFDSQDKLVEHALRHLRVIDTAYGMKNHGGVIGWCMFDYNTHKDFGSGDRICYHGVLDMFRLPKYAAAAYASQQNDAVVMEIASNMRMGDYAGSELSNVNIFTNCDYVKLYKNDVYLDSFYPARAEYPNLPNPPIVIDDFIGNQIAKNESFSSFDSKLLKTIFIEVIHHGLDGLPILSKLKMLFLLKKNRMTIQDGIELYGKYVGGWGDKSTTYKIEGYKDDALVSSQSRGQSFNQSLSVSVDCMKLVEAETWDTTRVTVQRVDENGSVMPYAHDVLNIVTEGPIDIIGPKNIALIGGGIAFWVKTKGRSGEACIKIYSEEFGVIEKRLFVEKDSFQ